MSVLQVRIVDFDLQIISYPLVLPYWNLELGKAVKISPQDHAISAKNSSCFGVMHHGLSYRSA